MFHIYHNNAEVMKWKMVEDDDCPSQPNSSLNYGLYYLKNMNFLTHKHKLHEWGFIEDDILQYQGEFGARILKEGLTQKVNVTIENIESILKKNNIYIFVTNFYGFCI